MKEKKKKESERILSNLNGAVFMPTTGESIFAAVAATKSDTLTRSRAASHCSSRAEALVPATFPPSDASRRLASEPCVWQNAENWRNRDGGGRRQMYTDAQVH